MTDVGVAPLREPTGDRGTVAALGDAETERAATPSTTSGRAKRTGSSGFGANTSRAGSVGQGSTSEGQESGGYPAAWQPNHDNGRQTTGTSFGGRSRQCFHKRHSVSTRDTVFPQETRVSTRDMVPRDRRDRCVRASRWLRPVEADATHRRRNHSKPDGLPSAGSSAHLGARKPEFTSDGREVVHRPCITGERGRAGARRLEPGRRVAAPRQRCRGEPPAAMPNASQRASGAVLDGGSPHFFRRSDPPRSCLSRRPAPSRVRATPPRKTRSFR
jgi:hypothetical protein